MANVPVVPVHSRAACMRTGLMGKWAHRWRGRGSTTLDRITCLKRMLIVLSEIIQAFTDRLSVEIGIHYWSLTALRRVRAMTGTVF